MRKDTLMQSFKGALLGAGQSNCSESVAQHYLNNSGPFLIYQGDRFLGQSL